MPRTTAGISEFGGDQTDDALHVEVRLGDVPTLEAPAEEVEALRKNFWAGAPPGPPSEQLKRQRQRLGVKAPSANLWKPPTTSARKPLGTSGNLCKPPNSRFPEVCGGLRFAVVCRDNRQKPPGISKNLRKPPQTSANLRKPPKTSFLKPP